MKIKVSLPGGFPFMKINECKTEIAMGLVTFVGVVLCLALHLALCHVN